MLTARNLFIFRRYLFMTLKESLTLDSFVCIHHVVGTLG